MCNDDRWQSALRVPGQRAPRADIPRTTWTWPLAIQQVTEEIVLRLARDRPEAHRRRKPGHGRRRGPELRGQRQAAPAGHLQGHLDSARRGRRGRRAGRGPGRLAHLAGQAAPGHQRRRSTHEGLLPGPGFRTERSSGCAWRTQAPCQHYADFDELLPGGGRSAGPGRKVVGWFQGRMEYGRAPWATAASSATPGIRRCRRT